MPSRSWPCPRCGGRATFVGDRRDRDGVTRRWMCVDCGERFRTREGLAYDGRHWSKGPDGRWRESWDV